MRKQHFNFTCFHKNTKMKRKPISQCCHKPMLTAVKSSYWITFTRKTNGAKLFFRIKLTKFNIDEPDGFFYYWHDLRTEEKIFSKYQSGGGSVIVWRAICYLRKMPSSSISTRMNPIQYQEMVGPLFSSKQL